MYLWLLYLLFGTGKIATIEPLSSLQATFKVVYRIRIYQSVGPSREEWREMIPPDVRDTQSTETKEHCPSGLVSPSDELKTKAERLVEQHGKLLTWSDDGTMFAYVDRNRAISPPKPNPWGCVDCFYPDLKIMRASDFHLLATVRLPEFGEHWNYPQNIAWSPDGRTLLVGSEAGSSDSHFSDYWLVDWLKKDWRYAGGGNSAQWSPGGSEIAWLTPRHLEALGKLRVWVVQLGLLDARTLKQRILTSGTSIVSDVYWCAG